ncbi:MAG: polysaccharide export protein EpsE [Burkholderiales bacterium]|nr:polysaccharide export protein EpsE [Burkholderiales bacterium]
MSLFFLCAAPAHALDYLLGPGDAIRISVYGNQDMNLETKVSEAGKITFPLIGEVIVGRLSASAAEKKIAGMLEAGGFLRNPQVNITVTMMQSQQVSVLGQVNRPGRYPLEGKRNLTDMLAMAGGIAADGADILTLIHYQDGKPSKQVIDIVDMFRSGDLKENGLIQGGDVIFVERAPRFYIYGEVQRPSQYRLERNMTVLQALSVAGGLTARGTERGVRIKRQGPDGKIQVLQVKHDDLVKVDDVIYIQESLF